MGLQELFEGFLKYSAKLFDTLFSLSGLLFIVPSLFLLRVTESETIAINALVFAFCADSALGIIEAFSSRKFDWLKLPGIIYKAIVYFFYLKIGQFCGDLLAQQGVGTGEGIILIFIVLMFVAEAKSGIVKAHLLYPNPVTAPIIRFLDLISINADAKLKGEIDKK